MCICKCVCWDVWRLHFDPYQTRPSVLRSSHKKDTHLHVCPVCELNPCRAKIYRSSLLAGDLIKEFSLMTMSLKSSPCAQCLLGSVLTGRLAIFSFHFMRDSPGITDKYLENRLWGKAVDYMDGLMNEWVHKLLTVARIFWMRFAHKTVYVHSTVLLITGLELYRTVPLGQPHFHVSWVAALHLPSSSLVPDK